MRLATAAFVAIASTSLAAQGGQPAAVAAETTATAIPGVIAAGTKIEVIKSGFSGTGRMDVGDGDQRCAESLQHG